MKVAFLDTKFKELKLFYNFLFKKTLNKEILCFLIFILTNFFVNRLLFQAIIIFVYTIVLYLINKNFTRSLWAVLLSTILFSLGRYFPFKFTTPYSGEVEAYKVFGFNFTDAVFIAFLYSLKKTSKKIKIKFGLVDFLIGSIILISILSSYFSPHADIAWFNLFQFLKLISLFYFSRIVFLRNGYSTLTIFFVAIYLVLNSMLMLAEKVNNGPLGLLIEDYFIKYGNYAQDAIGLYRPGGMAWDANFSAAYLSMGYVFLLSVFFNKETIFPKKIILILIVLFLSAIIISASRGSWLAVIIFSLFLVLKDAFDNKRQLKDYLKLKLLVPFLLILSLMGGFVVNRFQQLSSKMGISTVNTRLVHLKLGYFISLNYPIGTGPDTFQYEIMSMFRPKQYLFDSTPAHMMVGELLGDFGLFGTFLFLIFFYLIIRKFFIQKNKIKKSANNYYIKNGFFYSILVYLFLAQIYPLLFSFQISAIFWIMLGALYEYEQN